VVDIRVNDCYSNQEILQTVKENIAAEVTPRSMNLSCLFIPVTHALVQAGIIGKNNLWFPTLQTNRF
jgi:acetylornithine deacetylase